MICSASEEKAEGLSGQEQCSGFFSLVHRCTIASAPKEGLTESMACQGADMFVR